MSSTNNRYTPYMMLLTVRNPIKHSSKCCKSIDYLILSNIVISCFIFKNVKRTVPNHYVRSRSNITHEMRLVSTIKRSMPGNKETPYLTGMDLKMDRGITTIVILTCTMHHRVHLPCERLWIHRRRIMSTLTRKLCNATCTGV